MNNLLDNLTPILSVLVGPDGSGAKLVTVIPDDIRKRFLKMSEKDFNCVHLDIVKTITNTFIDLRKGGGIKVNIETGTLEQ